MKRQAGFSLVELMVVVSIIGILASVAVPSFQRFATKAKQAEAKAALSGVFTAERAFASEWNSYYGDFRNIGYQPVGQIRYRHGFNSGVACPNGYVGAGAAPGAALASTHRDTSGAICGSICTEMTNPNPPGNIGATAVANAVNFTAEARGDIDGDTTVDVWSVNEQKAFTMVADDILG